MKLLPMLSATLARLPFARRATLSLRAEPPSLSRSATVESVQSALRAAETGDTRLLFALYRDLTLGGSHIQSEFNKRKLAVLAQPHALLPADKNNPDDLAAVQAISQMIDGCENWQDGLTHLLDATLWPVAVCEKIHAPADPQPARDGTASAAANPTAPATRSGPLNLRYNLRRWEPVNPALLCFREPQVRRVGPAGGRPDASAEPAGWEPGLRLYALGPEGRIDYAPEHATALEPARHVVHRGHLLVGARDHWGGPMRAVLFWWLLGTLARDWFARGLERFGTPFVVGRTDVTNPGGVEFLKNALALSSRIGGLVVGHDTVIELKEAATSGSADAHERFLAVCNREISKVIVGQELSATAAATGLGSGVARLQENVREDIRMFDQLRLAETLRRQLFEPFLRINGLPGAAPQIVWGGLSDADAKLFADLLESLARAGWEPTDDAVPTLQARIGFPVQRRRPAHPSQGSD